MTYDGTITTQSSFGIPYTSNTYAYQIINLDTNDIIVNFVQHPASHTFTNIPNGNYRVTARDSQGCTATRDVTVNINPPITLTFNNSNVSTPAGNDGGIDITVAGGTPPFTYAWTGTPTPPPTTTTEDIENLVAGTYTVVITDARGCTKTQTFTIEDGEVIPLSLRIQKSDICNGTGTVIVTAVDGLPPYLYAVSPGATLSNPTWSVNNTFTITTAGTYTFAVRDAQGKEVYTTLDILQNDLAATINYLVCGQDPYVLGATVTGGITTFTYEWIYNGDIISTEESVVIPAPQVTTPITLVVTDAGAGGCAVTTTQDIFTLIEISAISNTACDPENSTLRLTGFVN